MITNSQEKKKSEMDPGRNCSVMLITLLLCATCVALALIVAISVQPLISVGSHPPELLEYYRMQKATPTWVMP